MLVRLQGEIKQKLETRDAKMEVLAQYWEQVLSSLIKIARKKKNHEMIEFTNKVFNIRTDLRNYVLKRFVK